LLLAHVLDNLGAGRVDGKRGHVHPRNHHHLRGARRESHHATQELSLLLGPGLPRQVGRQDAEDLVFGERCLAVGVEGKADQFEHRARRRLQQEKARIQHQTNGSEQRNGNDRRFPRALDGDELRHQLTEQHVEQGEHREGDAEDDAAPRGTELFSGERHDQAVAELGHGRLADPPEPEAHERDAELRDAEITIELVDRLLHDGLAPAARRFADAARRAELHEREFRGHEETVGDDEQGSQPESEHAGQTFSMAALPRSPAGRRSSTKMSTRKTSTSVPPE
jgi:hypothetical protein